MIKKKVIDQIRVEPGKKINLKDFDTRWTLTSELKDAGKEAVKEKAAAMLEANREELAKAQELLWASDIHSVLVVLQAMDAAGKDGIIKHVMSGINPQGCEVFSFKQPSAEELDHNFLWRFMRRLPERGKIGIFNRSYYEDVLVVKVHPEMIDAQKLPPGKRGDSFWQKRYDDINAFEHHLVRNGTLVLKFFLHISKDEQKKRFLERLDNPNKHWKFSEGDLAERAHWDDYNKAFEEAISATSTKWAPWYIIPADHKWVSRTLISDVLVTAIKSLKLEFPSVSEEKKAALVEARRQLEQEEN